MEDFSSSIVIGKVLWRMGGVVWGGGVWKWWWWYKVRLVTLTALKCTLVVATTARD